MMRMNPFKPTAGAEPPVLAGRDGILYDFEMGLEEGVGAPGRLMRITGPRGSGKTVLLTELGDIARRRGWRVLDVTAAERLPELICRRLERSSDAEYELGIDLMVVKASARLGDKGESADDVYEALGRVARALTKHGKGLLVTIDEIQDASIGEVREIAVAIQHLIREKQNIAFIFAGLTSGVMDLLGEDGPTFLRRAPSQRMRWRLHCGAPSKKTAWPSTTRHWLRRRTQLLAMLTLSSWSATTYGVARRFAGKAMRAASWRRTCSAGFARRVTILIAVCSRRLSGIFQRPPWSICLQ